MGNRSVIGLENRLLLTSRSRSPSVIGIRRFSYCFFLLPPFFHCPPETRRRISGSLTAMTSKSPAERKKPRESSVAIMLETCNDGKGKYVVRCPWQVVERYLKIALHLDGCTRLYVAGIRLQSPR